MVCSLHLKFACGYIRSTTTNIQAWLSKCLQGYFLIMTFTQYVLYLPIITVPTLDLTHTPVTDPIIVPHPLAKCQPFQISPGPPIKVCFANVFRLLFKRKKGDPEQYQLMTGHREMTFITLVLAFSVVGSLICLWKRIKIFPRYDMHPYYSTCNTCKYKKMFLMENQK